MKATEQYFPVMLFQCYAAFKVILTLKYLDEILKCGCSEQYFPVVLCYSIFCNYSIHVRRCDGILCTKIRIPQNEILAVFHFKLERFSW